MQALVALNHRLGSPSQRKLLLAARRDKLPLSDAEVLAFARSRRELHARAAPVPLKGRVVSSGPNSQWQVDVAHFGREANDIGAVGWVQATDVFTRQTRVALVPDARQATVTKAVESLLNHAAVRPGGARPGFLVSDKGPEFGGLSELCKRLGIAYDAKDPQDINRLAVLDRAMLQLKRGLKHFPRSEQPHHLRDVVRAYNEDLVIRVAHGTPDEVATNPTVHFLNLQDNA
jgi:hypothetical protein